MGITVINTAKATRNAQVLLDVELNDEFLQRIQTGNWTQVLIRMIKLDITKPLMIV